MKTVKILIASLILIPTFMSCNGQTKNAGGYPPLVKKDFDPNVLYDEHQDEKLIVQYLSYKMIPTFEEVNGNLRKEPLMWDMKPINTSDVLNLLNSRLVLHIPEFTHEQRYIICSTSAPETLCNDISELLTVQLLDYKLTDAAGNELKINTNNGVTLSYSSLFEENGTDHQHISIRMNLAEGSKFENIATGYVNIAFSLASGFDKVTLDKSQRGKTVSFDGEQVTLLEMEYNTVHLKLSPAAAKRADDWDFIACHNEAPIDGNLSSAEYPVAFYDFARKNKGLTYTNFEKEAANNEAAWKDTRTERCIVLYFDSSVTSLYIYRPQYTSVEKRIEIKGA